MVKYCLSAFADEAADSLDEQISALRENRIAFIEPRNIGGKPILTLTDSELIEVKKKLDEAGIKVNSLGSPIGKYPIEDDFEPHLALFKRALEVCKLLGTDKMRMFSFYVKQDELLKWHDEVIKRLKAMAQLAKEAGIMLCHENESLIYGQMPCEVKKILTEIPEIYGIFDPANYRMNDANVDAGIDATLTRLAYLHIKDATYSTQTILPAGEGEGKIAEIIDKVNGCCDGNVYLTLEPHLMSFFAYKDIDSHELKGKYSFETNRDAFDFAANKLKALLTENGYMEVEYGIWKK